MKWAVFIIFFAVLSCGRRHPSEKPTSGTPSSTEIKYAQGFKISVVGNSKLVEVTYPFQGAGSGYRYLLVPRGENEPPHDAQTRIIYVPLQSIVCTSTTHIPFLDYLHETEKLTGFPTTDYISSEKMRKRIDAGQVQELGIDNGLNLERLAVLQPDVVMGYTLTSDYGQFKKIEALNIPVVINAEYLEKHPLGRAEWIKFMALFFQKEKMADSVFTAIENNYLETKKLTRSAEERPTVLSGIVYGDAWFMPGGENYGATLLKDAGCHYLWSETPGNGYLELSFESVYEKANQADIWIGVGTFKSLKELEAADHRYALFRPYQRKQVYNYDLRKGAKGGNEYLELGYLRPDLILQDLVKISHPQLLPKYKLFFHRRLE
jgi:iron complex transport system substrate-binding protein